MENIVIVSDFDGTITRKDSLYNFFKEYANEKWLEIEKLWVDKKIGSKECLKKQFELVDNLNYQLIDKYINTVELDIYFKEFNELRIKKNIDLIIVSDGIDYFIYKILQKSNIKDIKVISNHLEFENEKVKLSFPNSNEFCINNSATCKCHAVSSLRNKYQNIIYIGDGTSDFCISENLKQNDILFAKGSLLKHCKDKHINCIEYQNFKNIINYLNN